PPRFNGDMIKDIKSKNYEVELVKESGDYLPVTYRQVKGIGYSPDWKCDQQYIPFMKEFRARKRAEK
ncbi:hypothetical protein V7Z47_17445, partial [Priestia megaterium]|uniref:hypothetical protein n=1 Tax=Priestia megaterium TaxID=1404 RepID=UPI002FFF7338